MIPINAITDPKLTALDIRVLAFIQCYGMLSTREIGKAIGVGKSAISCSIIRLKNTNYVSAPVDRVSAPVDKNGLHKDKAFKKLLYIKKENEGVPPVGQIEVEREAARRAARAGAMRAEGRAEEEIESYLKVAQENYPIPGGDRIPVEGRKNHEAR